MDCSHIIPELFRFFLFFFNERPGYKANDILVLAEVQCLFVTCWEAHVILQVINIMCMCIGFNVHFNVHVYKTLFCPLLSAHSVLS